MSLIVSSLIIGGMFPFAELLSLDISEQALSSVTSAPIGSRAFILYSLDYQVNFLDMICWKAFAAYSAN